MIILGALLMVLGFVFGIPFLWTIGIIVLIVGVVFLFLGSGGRAGVGGRRYWY